MCVYLIFQVCCAGHSSQPSVDLPLALLHYGEVCALKIYVPVILLHLWKKNLTNKIKKPE